MDLLKVMTRKQTMVAVAGAAVGALASTSHAAVVYTPASILVDSATHPTQNIDINGDGTSDFAITASTTDGIQIQKMFDENTNVNANSILSNVQQTTDTLANALALSAGDTVPTDDGEVTHFYNTAANLISANGTVGNFTVAAGAKYLGVNIVPASGGPDLTQAKYAYILFQTLSTGSDVSGKILGYGYNTSVAQSVVAGATGAVPEPTSLGMLAMGAVGIAAYRRRAR